MPSISELFVTLGVKGSEKTVEAFAKVGTGIKNVATMSFEAKAAIIGATYALEQLMSSSAERGTELSNLSQYLGISTKQLQQWQFAARQAGESGEEFTASLKSVYEKIAQMRMGKQRPEGFAIFSQAVGGFDIEKSYHDIFYTLSKLQEFAKSNIDTLVQNPVLKSFGLSENTIAAMRKGVFNTVNIKRAPTYNDQEIKSLNQVKVLWDNLENKVAMFFGHFTAKNGKEMIENISKTADQLFKIAEALEKISSKLHAMDHITDVFKGWSVLLQTVSDLLEGKSTKELEKNKLLGPAVIQDEKLSAQKNLEMAQKNIEFSLKREQIGNILPSFFGSIRDSLSNSKSYLNPELDKSTDFKDILNNIFNYLPNNQQGLITPPVPYTQNSSNKVNNTSINQNLYFQHEGKEYGKIQSSVNESIVLAWKQLSAQSQAT